MKILSYIKTILLVAIIIYLLIVLTTSFVIWEWKETIYNIALWDTFTRGWYLSIVATISGGTILKEETSHDTY